jgi:hypothetical protein
VAGAAGSSGASGADAGLDPLSGLTDCVGDVGALLIATKAAMPKAGSEAYTLPSAPEIDALQESVSALVAADVPNAVTRATSAGYSLCRSGTVALYRPLDAGAGSASFAWRSSGARPVIVEAPHPLHDGKTLEEGVVLFDTLSARAIIASGTHRCANSATSACSGTTEACSPGTLQKYKQSDMAHVVDSFFHRVHVTLADLHPNDLVIGLHGMKDGGASISDGTELATSDGSVVARLAAELAKGVVGTPVAAEPITTCNDYPGAPAVDNRMCGTTDVQGRTLNGSSSACTQAAGSSSGRFLHLEQSSTLRDLPDLVAAAFGAVVPAAP